MSEQAFDWKKILNKDEEQAETPQLEVTNGVEGAEAQAEAGEAPVAEGDESVKFSIADSDAMADAESDIAEIVKKVESKAKPSPLFELIVNDESKSDTKAEADDEGPTNKPAAEEAAQAEEYKHYKPAALPDDLYTKPLHDTGEAFIGMEHVDVKPSTEVSGDAKSVKDVHIDEILRSAIERKASDIHFTIGLPPMARIDGELQPLPYQILEPEDIQRMVYEVLSDEQIQKFEQTHELDFGYGVKGLGRFRFNVYFQKGAMAGALRAIPTRIPAFEELGLPPVIREMAKRVSGLVLVTGPTGSGKSTTIASMIDDINQTRTSHILTIEDPIEYLHSHKKCMINQRELHSDTYSFHNSLRAVLREDPDIILVGELRDLETIEAALTLAETGHLVFGTLHTRNAPSTIDRIVDVFPADQQEQIRVLLGNTLEGVISQQLIPRLGGGRSASLEIMIGTPAIKNLIREGKTHQMYSIIETNAQHGMQTMDRSLADLFRNGYCSYDECLMRAVDKESFARLAKGAA